MLKRGRLLLVTTVPETFATILNGQPRQLAKYFDVGLVSSSGDQIFQVEKAENIKVTQMPMVRGIDLYRDMGSVLRMVHILRKHRPDVVHSYTPKAGLVTMLAACLCRVPVRVHTFTGLIFPTSQGFKKKLLMWVDRLICACATHIVPEGLGVKNDLEKFRITSKPLQVIGHGNIAGVDTAYFSPLAPGVDAAAAVLRERLGIGEDSFVFCFVGRLNQDKGLVELMQAFVALPPSAHLLLVGDVDQTAPVGSEVLAAIAAHPRVHALGFLDDIRAALHAADVLVLPSYREGFPNSVLQAGAMALPVIATNINGCNEVIEPGVNGWLVPPRDAPALQVTMQEAMQAPSNVLQTMGRQARIRIQQWFEQQQHWERMVDFSQGLLGEKSKG